jgi:O-antigen/teichoic acid export membrane protein
MQAVDPIVMPYFSEKLRRGEGLAAASGAATSAVMTIAAPFFAFVATSAVPLVYVLFGETWMASAQFVPLLCVAAGIRCAVMFANRLAVVTDRLDLSVKAFCATAFVQIAAVIIAAPTGLLGICIALVLAACLHSYIWGRVTRTIVSTMGFMSSVRAAFLPTLLVLLASGAVNLAGPRLGLPEVVVLFSAAGVSGLVWLAGLRLSRNALFDELLRALSDIRQNLRLRLRRA